MRKKLPRSVCGPRLGPVGRPFRFIFGLFGLFRLAPAPSSLVWTVSASVFQSIYGSEAQVSRGPDPVGILRICGLEIGGHARDKRAGTFGSSHEVILIKLN